jgi:release factor glutamine methyltransferase
VHADEVAARLRSAGFLAPEHDADLLVEAALCDEELEALVRRRVEGEPVEWLVGRTSFAGVEIRVHPGVYVPRRQSEALVAHARAHRPAHAVDVCCGTGAVGVAIGATLATDVDLRAVANARANGLDARAGDLLDPITEAVDLVVAVPPYVPTGRLDALPRDVRAHEPVIALDGGADGLDVVRRLVAEAAARPSVRVLLLEVGLDEVDTVAQLVVAHGFRVCARLADDDGDVRCICATRS